MDRNAYRDDNGTDQPRTRADPPKLYPDEDEPYADEYEPYPDQPGPYWRRRVATLAAGLGVLGLLAWAFSGGGGKPAPAPHNSPAGALSNPSVQPSVGASAGPSAGPSAGAGPSASTGTGANAAIPGLNSHGTSGLPSATTSPARKSAKASAVKSDAAAATGIEPGGRCSPNSVVLSLFGGSRSYPAGQNPQFGVNAVSTAAGTCTFELGPGHLHLVVMSAGRVIWDSADCARGDGTQLTKLTRGIPVQEHFTWNRAITLPGCVTLATSARPGSYQAQAQTSGISSGTFTFKLAR